MVTEPPPTSWPPVLAVPATESLAVAFAGFDGAAARLAEVIDAAGSEPDDRDRVMVNVELSALLWFARTAVDQVRAREDWPGGARGFDRDQDAAGHGDLLNGFRWARNHAGHALARTGRDTWVPGRPYAGELFHAPAELWWLWTPRGELPDPHGRLPGWDAYDRRLANTDVRPAVIAMAAWLNQTDRELAERT